MEFAVIPEQSLVVFVQVDNVLMYLLKRAVSMTLSVIPLQLIETIKG